MLTCQHAGEEHGREVVVEVEDPAHQEEWEVMQHPAEQELTASLQKDLGQPWAPSSTAWSAAREGAETPGSRPALPLPCWVARRCPVPLLGLPPSSGAHSASR